MAHPAPVSGAAGDAWPEDQGPRASVRARHLPDVVQLARAELFRDSDQHGPRWPVLVRRAAPALLLVPLGLALASLEPWRGLLLGQLSASITDVVLVTPVLVALVALAAALAPLARVRIAPLLAGACVVLGIGLWLVASGWLVVASIPTAVGAVLLGVAAARAVRRAVWTLPLLLAAGISDTHSVQVGLTSELLGGDAGRSVAQVAAVLAVPPAAVQRIDLLVLHVPAATGTWMLGIVDVVALGLLLGLAHLFWLPLGRTAIALGVALVATIGFGVPVPVLPMLGFAWVAVNARLVWRATRFSLRRLTYLGG